jgi:hypothetical protein
VGGRGKERGRRGGRERECVCERGRGGERKTKRVCESVREEERKKVILCESQGDGDIEGGKERE